MIGLLLLVPIGLGVYACYKYLRILDRRVQYDWEERMRLARLPSPTPENCIIVCDETGVGRMVHPEAIFPTNNSLHSKRTEGKQ